ncbi:MAG: alcohol dehydrogenase catalytic domain-containing protein, partial [Candidatus Humimicrobiaceae bacterium]
LRIYTITGLRLMVLVYTTDFSKIPYKNKVFSQFRDKLTLGDRVAIYLAIGCGKCHCCLQGYPMLCKEFRCPGFDLDGGHADYVVVPEINCLPFPDARSFVAGVLSTDVGGTLYTACKRLKVSGSKTLAIFGVGPMGSGGVLIAKAYGARVIAVDTDPQRLEHAKRLGQMKL